MILDNPLYFDIETGKSPEYMKFLPEFKPPRITKTGQPHAGDKSIEDQEIDWTSKCALKATTGRVILITYMNGTTIDIHSDKSEKEILEHFWDAYHAHTKQNYLIGWNTHDFDLPFLKQRSWILGVKTGLNPLDRNFQMSIDLEEVWNSFKYGKMTSLDDAGRALNVGCKFQDGEVSKNFEEFWTKNPALTFEACKYDIKLLKAVAEVML